MHGHGLRGDDARPGPDPEPLEARLEAICAMSAETMAPQAVSPRSHVGRQLKSIVGAVQMPRTRSYAGSSTSPVFRGS